MTEPEVVTLQKQLFEQHGIPHWNFKFDNAKRRNGICSHSEETISISRNYVRLNTPELIQDTLLHEIAHALVGFGSGHDRKWKAKCIEIGARPVRCKDADEVKHVKGDWVAHCPNCNREFNRINKPRKGYQYSCQYCDGKRFNPLYELIYKKAG